MYEGCTVGVLLAMKLVVQEIAKLGVGCGGPGLLFRLYACNQRTLLRGPAFSDIRS